MLLVLDRKETSNVHSLTRREREVMDALYRLGEGTVAEVQATLMQKAHYSTVRAQLSVLEHKGQVLHHERHLRYVYVPVLPKEQAGIAALRHVLKTFFDGSIENLLTSLLCEVAPEERRESARSKHSNENGIERAGRGCVLAMAVHDGLTSY